MPNEQTNPETVTITEKPAGLKPEPTPSNETQTSLKEKGWSEREIQSAEKRGLIKKPVEPSVNSNKPSDAGSPPNSTTTNAAKPPEQKADGERAGERRSEPSFLEMMDKELTPEQEKFFLENFPPGTKPRAFYFRAKNERTARQRAEAERDRLALELQLAKDNKAHPQDQPPQEVDENGNPIDPEDKPLTMKQLRAMQRDEMERARKHQEDLQVRSAKVAEALQTQEEFARSTLQDFDNTVKLAADLVKNVEQIPEKWKRDKVLKLLTDLQTTAATADKYGLDDYNAPMISYELGQLHPDYGRKQPSDINGDTKDHPKGNGSLTPEQMKRIEENTQRRASSASLPGTSAGSRTISVDEIKIKDVLAMTVEERFAFKKKYPEKMAKLMRG